MTDDAIVFPGPILTEAIDAMEDGVDRLVQRQPKALLITEKGEPHFRYLGNTRTSQTFQVLKAVRVVSGLRAASALVKIGYHQEAGVVLRSLHEALEDIDTIHEAQTRQEGPTEYQRKLVDVFFIDDVATVRKIIAGEAKPIARVPRKKKHAAIARQLSEAAQGRPVRRSLEAIASVLDGHVHCGYASIMDLYSSSPARKGFHMRGVNHPGRHRMLAVWVAMFAHHGLNSIAGILFGVSELEAGERLIGIRDRLETSSEYP